MTKKLLPYEIGKLAIVLWCIASAALIAVGLYRIVWNLLQCGYALIPADLWHTIFEEPSSEKLQPIIALVRKYYAELTLAEAKSGIWLGVLILVLGSISMIFARDQLKRQERRVKRTFFPTVLAEHFSGAVYSPEKKRSEDEPLCRLGLLRYYERYYTANRLEALYRDCWVAAEEVICGGVYGEGYASHKVKVRGQWLTVRLSQPMDSTVVLESRSTQNRLTHDKIAGTMTEVCFSFDDFANAFRCFAESPEFAQQLITRQFADRLLAIKEKYGDFCVIFDGSNFHILLRRRSFDRRLECLLPYTEKLLKKEEYRLYQPLRDFTDLLLD